MSRAARRIRRVMDRRYGVGILLLAAASTMTFLASTHLTRIEAHRAEALALVANQRVLSQRIAFLVAALGEAPDEEAIRTELLSATRAMRHGHELLTLRDEGAHDIAHFVEPLQGVYFSGWLTFDRDVTRFLGEAERVAALPRGTQAWDRDASRRSAVVAAGTNAMLQTHDLMVRIMEVDARAAVVKAQRVDMALWGFVLALILLITLVIWRPMSAKVFASILGHEAAEARARLAAQEADAAKAAKGHFLQAASHELRTPLNALTGFADVLGGASEADAGALRQMQLAGDHLSALLDTIIDTHRAQEGTLVLARAPVRLTAAVEAAARIAAALAERKGLSFSIAIDAPSDLHVLADEARLRRVVLNLLDNAVKFTAQGGVSVRVEAEEDGDGGVRVEVAIHDTGCGIEPERVERIFDRFSASGEMLSRGGGGLGIGLSLTRELAGLMGGEVAISSEVGVGTEALLVLCLPRAEGAPAALPSPEMAALRVLIVDDNLPNRMVAEAMIAPLCARCALAADGAEGVALAEAEPFDVILMDISMPVLDGVGATRAIRSGGGPNAQTPILAVTAHVAPDESEALLCEGFQNVISKPVRREVLAAAVARWARVRLDEEDDEQEDGAEAAPASEETLACG